MSRKTKQPPAFIRRRFFDWRGESLFTPALTEITSSKLSLREGTVASPSPGCRVRFPNSSWC